jgi:2-amino-4-hydroxy-6-hydroxymethyldihydropteridine diphosphokinase
MVTASRGCATYTAYIGVGSNMGDRRGNIEAAVRALGGAADIDVVAVSSVQPSRPVGGPAGQRDYFNAVVAILTTLDPRALLDTLRGVEQQLGRRRAERWGPRTIDLDLLLYDQQTIDEEDLVVPHPRMHQRRFVMEPLAEIAPDVMHPVLGRSANEILRDLPEDAAEGGHDD